MKQKKLYLILITLKKQYEKINNHDYFNVYNGVIWAKRSFKAHVY